jgi:hypothetical protein
MVSPGKVPVSIQYMLALSDTKAELFKGLTPAAEFFFTHGGRRRNDAYRITKMQSRRFM